MLALASDSSSFQRPKSSTGFVFPNNSLVDYFILLTDFETDILSPDSQVKDIAKAKAKPKDPAGILVSEACTYAQGMVDSGEEVTADILARLVKLKITAARDEYMEHKAAEQRAREAEMDAKVENRLTHGTSQLSHQLHCSH